MDMLALGLSLEQKFSLRKYEEQVQKLSLTQAQELLVEALSQLMVKDNTIRSLVKSGSGLG
jgi:Phycobilisome degradation protein nblA